MTVQPDTVLQYPSCWARHSGGIVAQALESAILQPTHNYLAEGLTCKAKCQLDLLKGTCQKWQLGCSVTGTRKALQKTRVSQCLLHMPQLLPEFWAFAVLSAVPKAKSTWIMCGKHCDTWYDVRFRSMMVLQLSTPDEAFISHARIFQGCKTAGCSSSWAKVSINPPDEDEDVPCISS